jgi:hypothetical protein
MLLMMGGKTPETCWATHKRKVKNLWNCCILLVDLFESYDDARTCERQASDFFDECWVGRLRVHHPVSTGWPRNHRTPTNTLIPLRGLCLTLPRANVRFSQSSSVALRGVALLNRSRCVNLYWVWGAYCLGVRWLLGHLILCRSEGKM